MCLLQWSASMGTLLWSGDCKSAFLQGAEDTERPESIYMKPPVDPISRQGVAEWNEPNLLYKLTAPVYGQSNAPRRWFIHLTNVLRKLGWQAHSLDPCLWMFKAEHEGKKRVTALLGVHVDDLILTCLPGHESKLKAVENSFVWGNPWKSREFTFVGRHLKQHEDGSITVDQADYIAEVPSTRTKLEATEKLAGHPELVTEFRSGIGSLQWLAGTSRGDISADVSLLQRPPKDLTVNDLLEINGVLRYVRATNDSSFRIVPIDIDSLMFVAYGDSGWANAPNGRSQGGLVVVATNKAALTSVQPASLLEWKSYRHQRVLRSTLAAEAASLDRTEDYAHFLSALLSEMVDANHIATMKTEPLFEVAPVTDARSLCGMPCIV